MTRFAHHRNPTNEADAALMAAVGILRDESLPFAARVKAHLRCLDAHARLSGEMIQRIDLDDTAASVGRALLEFRPLELLPWERHG